MDKVIRLFCIIMFDGNSGVVGVIVHALFLVGLWRLLEKSGLKGWWALIPGARDYQLCRCAGREPEGRVYSVTGVAVIVLSAVMLFTQPDVENAETPSGIAIVFSPISISPP